jgi:hypothetical protein
MESSWDNIFVYLTHYKELDKEYPNSKFILNVRDVEDWIKSRLNHEGYLDSYKFITGLDDDSIVTHWKDIWFKHINDVQEYFKNRESDFIMFDIKKESTKLINFMSKFTDLCYTEFGHYHKTELD